jgi:hypothetical protein
VTSTIFNTQYSDRSTWGLIACKLLFIGIAVYGIIHNPPQPKPEPCVAITQK